MTHVRELVDAGKVDTTSAWSDAAPSTEDANALIEAEGYDEYGTWRLGTGLDASDEAKDRYHFPFGDFSRVVRSALIHAELRASQNGHAEVARAAKGLLDHVDATRSSSSVVRPAGGPSVSCHAPGATAAIPAGGS